MENRIVVVAELRSAISVMQIDDDVSGIEQSDQMLREISESIDAQLPVAEQDRARLGNAKSATHDRKINIRQILRRRTSPMSRLPAISGTVEHTTFALAIFARTGASMSPAAGGSRKTPPIRSRLSLKAARWDAGR
jgi:hypothetical protein